MANIVCKNYFIISGWNEEKMLLNFLAFHGFSEVLDEMSVKELVKSAGHTMHSTKNKQIWTDLTIFYILFVHSAQASVQWVTHSLLLYDRTDFLKVVDETAVEKLVKSPRRTVLHSGKVLKRIAVAQKSVAIWLP